MEEVRQIVIRVKNVQGGLGTGETKESKGS